LLKARQAADLSGLPALADDSGLCVDALNGDPGIFSARWAGETKDFGMAMRLVEEHLGRAPKGSGRDAHFVCALALCWPNGSDVEVQGRVDGLLVNPPRGDRGFGYDAMFVANGQTLTFGEMDPDAKHEMSHRADAFAKLVAAVF
jgi:XTP/dITP diphosphohydrolase